TELLRAWTEGKMEARDRVVPLVYEELRRRAAAHLRRERAAHTLRPTALVHEAFLRLGGQERIEWKNRAQFFGVAAELAVRSSPSADMAPTGLRIAIGSSKTSSIRIAGSPVTCGIMTT